MEKESLGKRVLNILKRPFATLSEAFSETEAPEDITLSQEEELEVIRIQKEQMKASGKDVRSVVVEKVIPNDIYDNASIKPAKAKKKQGPVLEGPSLD